MYNKNSFLDWVLIMSNEIILERFAYHKDGTFGVMTLPSGLEVYTVECPWKANKVSISCVPDGVYSLIKRPSGVVTRTSGEQYTEGWEVTEVPNRTYIMIHPGNWPHNFEGCIGVGSSFRILNDRNNVARNAVTDSQNTFVKVMEDLNQKKEWILSIMPYVMQYP